MPKTTCYTILVRTGAKSSDLNAGVIIAERIDYQYRLGTGQRIGFVAYRAGVVIFDSINNAYPHCYSTSRERIYVG